MKEKGQTIFNIISIALLIICIMKITWLNTEITNFKNSISNEYRMIESSMDDISSSVRYELEQANNLLSASDWEIKTFSIEDKTAVFSCYVVPKVYNPEKTVASLMCDGEELPMTLDHGRYKADGNISLFEETKITHVQFVEDGVIRTQQLDWVINPRYDKVPSAYINYSGSSSFAYRSEEINASYKGYIDIDMECKGFDGDIKDGEVVILINDEEAWRSNPVLEKVDSDTSFTHYRAEIDHDFDVQEGDTIKMYMSFIHETGLVYRSLIQSTTVRKNGNQALEQDYYREAHIYDGDGNLLFQSEEY